MRIFLGKKWLQSGTTLFLFVIERAKVRDFFLPPDRRRIDREAWQRRADFQDPFEALSLETRPTVRPRLNYRNGVLNSPKGVPSRVPTTSFCSRPKTGIALKIAPHSGVGVVTGCRRRAGHRLHWVGPHRRASPVGCTTRTRSYPPASACRSAGNWHST